MKKLLLFLIIVQTGDVSACGRYLTFLLQKLGICNSTQARVAQSSMPSPATEEIKEIERLRDALIESYKHGQTSEEELKYQIPLLFFGGIIKGIDRQTLAALFPFVKIVITESESGLLKMVPKDDGTATVFSENVRYAHLKND